MSWLWRGFQSAVFYYLSCAPCTKIAYQRRRHKATQRAKAERTATEMEQGLYQHPSPFSTNIYWGEEMALGPGPPQRKNNKDRERAKAESSRGLRSGGAGSGSVAGTSSAVTVVEMDLEDDKKPKDQEEVGRRYQREDENLWGISSESLNTMSRSSTTGSRTGGNYYYVARNPAVNDLHPPVVSTQPTHPSQTRWMLQPPPSARIMEGKILSSSSRRRSGSGVSNASDSSRRRDDRSLGRKMGEKLLEGKVRRAEGSMRSTSTRRLPSGESARSSEVQSHPSGQPHDRDDHGDGVSSSVDNLVSNSDDHPPRRASYLRPPLSTVTSSSTNIPPAPSNPDLDGFLHFPSENPHPDPIQHQLQHPLNSKTSTANRSLSSSFPSLNSPMNPSHSPSPNQRHKPWSTSLPTTTTNPHSTGTDPNADPGPGPGARTGEMDWRFSLDARQKQLALETERETERGESFAQSTPIPTPTPVSNGNSSLDREGNRREREMTRWSMDI